MFLNIIDEFSRMVLAIRVGKTCKAVDVVDTLEELLSKFSAPTHICMDNGPGQLFSAFMSGVRAVEPARSTSH